MEHTEQYFYQVLLETVYLGGDYDTEPITTAYDVYFLTGYNEGGIGRVEESETQYDQYGNEARNCVSLELKARIRGSFDFMRLYIEKVPPPKHRQRCRAIGESTSSFEARSVASEASQRTPMGVEGQAGPGHSKPSKVYVVVIEKEYQVESYRQETTWLESHAYGSIKEANDAAFQYLLQDVCVGGPDADDVEGDIPSRYTPLEDNRGSDTVPYEGVVYLEGDPFSVTARVEEFVMKYAQTGRKRSASLVE